MEASHSQTLRCLRTKRKRNQVAWLPCVSVLLQVLRRPLWELVFVHSLWRMGWYGGWAVTDVRSWTPWGLAVALGIQLQPTWWESAESTDHGGWRYTVWVASRVGLSWAGRILREWGPGMGLASTNSMYLSVSAPSSLWQRMDVPWVRGLSASLEVLRGGVEPVPRPPLCAGSAAQLLSCTATGPRDARQSLATRLRSSVWPAAWLCLHPPALPAFLDPSAVLTLLALFRILTK